MKQYLAYENYVQYYKTRMCILWYADVENTACSNIVCYNAWNLCCNYRCTV